MSEQNQSVEVDMSTVERVFRYASDTIVEASRLRGEFQQLSYEVAGLRDDLSKLRRQNEFLDEQLTHVREQRDNAHRKTQELESVLHERNTRITAMEGDATSYQGIVEDLRSKLTNSNKERDDAQLRVMELEESEGKLRAKLAEVEAKAAEIAKLFAPQATPEQKPEPVVADPSLRQPGETEEQHRERTQPRDPVTQQWRSPYGDIGQEPQAAKPIEEDGWR